jgi:hypothetical protein
MKKPPAGRRLYCWEWIKFPFADVQLKVFITKIGYVPGCPGYL